MRAQARILSVLVALMFAVPPASSGENALSRGNQSAPGDHDRVKSRPPAPKGEFAPWVVQRARTYLHKLNATPKEFYEKWFPGWDPKNTETKEDGPFWTGQWLTTDRHHSDDVSQTNILYIVWDTAWFVEKGIEELKNRRGTIDLPLDHWLECILSLKKLAFDNEAGEGEPWTPEKVRLYWAVMEYMNGLVIFYAKHGDVEKEFERSRSTLLNLRELTDEQRRVLSEIKPDSQKVTFKDFSAGLRKRMEAKYPDLPIFASEHPEKACLDVRIPGIQHSAVMESFRKTKPGTPASEPWNKVPK